MLSGDLHVKVFIEVELSNDGMSLNADIRQNWATWDGCIDIIYNYITNKREHVVMRASKRNKKKTPFSQVFGSRTAHSGWIWCVDASPPQANYFIIKYNDNLIIWIWLEWRLNQWCDPVCCDWPSMCIVYMDIRFAVFRAMHQQVCRTIQLMCQLDAALCKEQTARIPPPTHRHTL